MIVYVMKWTRVDYWDALIAKYIQKYVFVGSAVNVCLVMTQSPEDYLGMTPDEQDEVLKGEAEENEHFASIFEIVRRNPRRVIFVDNADPTSRKCSKDEEEQDRRMRFGQHCMTVWCSCVHCKLTVAVVFSALYTLCSCMRNSNELAIAPLREACAGSLRPGYAG